MTAGEEAEMQELVATKVTEGLSPEESTRLDTLLATTPELDLEGFEHAAAAIHLALLRDEQPMPANVRLRLVEAGERYAASGDTTALDRPTPRRAVSGGTFGWWAAAAALILAIAGWWPRLQDPQVAAEPATDTGTTPIELVDSPAALRLSWEATDDATAVGATGEVVWNNELQTGMMRFSGLAANDPTRFQYQLWIFDRARDERYPVDGGVFDITPSEGAIEVPIDAKIDIVEPHLFAVTVERPGGVVVSTRERIALLASA